MSQRMLAGAGLTLWLALATASCSDSRDPAEDQADASVSHGAPSEAGVAADGGRVGDIDAAIDASLPGAADAARPGALSACLERPGSSLASPPSGELPCSLLPPGFAR